MDYKEFVFSITKGEEYQRDMLIQALSEIGFDTFEETENGFKAFIPEGVIQKNLLDEILADFTDMEFSFEENTIKQENWNEVWESNFEPLIIANTCYVRATFHQPRPEFPYEIVIDPKMAFGTGHHQTTTMMMEYMLEENFAGKAVLDMGCGTGILAILAQKLGAQSITAIDYDDICYQSTLENSELNKADMITALCGSKEVIPDAKFDIILANINRNILLDQLERYAEVLKPGGSLYLSGFYETHDMEIIVNKTQSLGLAFVSNKVLVDWTAVKFVY